MPPVQTFRRRLTAPLVLFLMQASCASRPPSATESAPTAAAAPRGAPPRSPVSTPLPSASPLSLSARITGQVTFRGMCDASGAVALGGSLIAVADDEDNVLRVYHSGRGGDPVASVDVSPALQLPAKKRPPELDIEAATRVGSHAFWLTSHGRNSRGKLQEARFRLFATSAPPEGRGLTPIGRPYNTLLDDLIRAPALGPFRLAEASLLPPKEAGGLNIEGMTGHADGRSLWIGFRNPLPQGRALVVPLLNPIALVEAGGRAAFGPPTLLDLGGLGIRALSRWRDRYLIVGGAIDAGAPSRLFVWDGEGSAPAPVAVDWQGLNPEAFAAARDGAALLVLSDDGSLPVDGVDCKRLPAPEHKRFRGAWLDITESARVP